MRIAFISGEYPPDNGKGGIGTYTEQISQGLANLGWDVHVFAGSQFRKCEEIINKVNIHRVLYSNPNDFHLKVLPVFEKEHSRCKFDMIESAEIQGNAWEIKKVFPHIPLIVRLHGPGFLVDNLKNRYVTFFAKLRFVLGSIKRGRFDLGYWRSYDKSKDPDYEFIQLADRITAPSGAMRDWVVKNWHIPKKSIEVIPNIFFPSSDWLNIPIDKEYIYRRIVFFGRLNVLKGLVNCSKAIKVLLKKNPEWRFVIIGDDGPGPYGFKSMKVWIQKYLEEVNTQVEFVNGLSYDELPIVIANSEIVILPSLFESFSYTCIEGMSAGKAVIGSKKGGMSDLIKHLESGILINPENVSEIYNAINKLIADNTLRYNLSVNARKRIQTQFNGAITLKSFSRFYENILMAND